MSLSDLVPAEYRLAAILIAALALVGMGAAAAWTVQGWRLDASKAEYAGFVATTKANGEAAEREAARIAAADKQRKDQADEENRRTLDRLRADVKRLRDANPASGIVPAAAAGASRPELACFDRAELGRAVGSLVESVRGLADEGDAATVNLDTARRWAAGRSAAAGK